MQPREVMASDGIPPGDHAATEDTRVDGRLPTMPATVGRYTLVRQLATGGMAELHLARPQDDSELLVVIKRLRPELAVDPEMVKMFLDEAAIAAHLRHPNIARTLDLDRDGGQFHLTLEFLRGVNVVQLCRRLARTGRTLPLRHALAIVIGACRGLQYAHERRDEDGTPLGIVHRDISPQNLVVTFDGVPKLVDFGIAKAATSFAKTNPGSLKGKLPYMSPEQCLSAEVDRRTDLFSLSIILWELTTGARLYRGRSDLEVMISIVEHPARQPSSVRPSYPAELEAIVMRGLRRDIDARYQTAAEMRHDLEQYASFAGMSVSESALSDFLKQIFADREAIDELVDDADESSLPDWDDELEPTACGFVNGGIMSTTRISTDESGLPEVDVSSSCDTLEEFIARFRRLCSGSTLFVPTTAPAPAGVRAYFSIRLSDGEVVLSGRGLVSESHAPGRPRGEARIAGMRIEFDRIDPECEAVFQWLVAARRLNSQADVTAAVECRVASTTSLEAPRWSIVLDRIRRSISALASGRRRRVVAHAVFFFLGLLVAYRLWGLS